MVFYLRPHKLNFANCFCIYLGTCTDKFLGYDCSCFAGYNGTNCDREADECTFGYCKNSVKCTDKFLDYECTCMKG